MKSKSLLPVKCLSVRNDSVNRYFAPHSIKSRIKAILRSPLFDAWNEFLKGIFNLPTRALTYAYIYTLSCNISSYISYDCIKRGNLKIAPLYFFNEATMTICSDRFVNYCLSPVALKMAFCNKVRILKFCLINVIPSFEITFRVC